MNSDIKPDFGKLAEAHCNKNHNGDIIEYIIKYNGFVDASNKIWTDHVEPLLSTVKRLQEENEQLKEEKKELVVELEYNNRFLEKFMLNHSDLFFNQLSNHKHLFETRIGVNKKAILKSSELNKES